MPEFKPRQKPKIADLKRKKELLKNAEIAYKEVPTQEEMLNGGKPLPAEFEKRGRHSDPVLTHEINDVLYEAAQNGNIGGG